MLAGMRTRTVAAALVAAAALAGCSSASSATPEAPTYTSPSDMSSKASSAVTLSDCNEPAVDIDGAVYVQCSADTGIEGALLRFETIRADRQQTAVEHLTKTGWTLHAGDGWLVAANAGATKYLPKVAAAVGATGEGGQGGGY